MEILISEINNNNIDNVDNYNDPINLDKKKFKIKKIDIESLHFVINKFKKNKKTIDYDSFINIVNTASDILSKETKLIKFKTHKKTTIVGDIHGNLKSLLTIFKNNGFPSDTNSYIFNGDFIDRGKYSHECLTILLMLKCIYPNNVILIKGNHEQQICSFDSKNAYYNNFLIMYKLDCMQYFNIIHTLFAKLPISCILNDSIIILHGGIHPDLNVEDLNTLTNIELLKKYKMMPDETIETYILWSDPNENVEYAEFNKNRKQGIFFGKNALDNFLKINNFKMIIRSHEYVVNGYDFKLNNKCLTIFSSANYCNALNKAGYIVINENDLNKLNIFNFFHD